MYGVYDLVSNGTTTTGEIKCALGSSVSGGTSLYCSSSGEWVYSDTNVACGAFVIMFYVVHSNFKITIREIKFDHTLHSTNILITS